ncbi:MAG: sugar-binding domain-containing protein, partial [Acutalibacteraceae bacterium]
MTTQNIPRPEHPNPIMYRESWQNLNGEWLFEIDYGVSGVERGLYKTDAKDKYTRKITVPFCPESELSGIGEKDFMPSVWYKRVINITKEQLCGRVLLHFGAVDYECNVYINGVFVGNHFGGYSSFALDITDYLQVGENDITVNARDDLRSYAQPSGKQSKEYYSHGCDYTRTTGIWQTVWLEFVPCGYIKSAKFYPDVQGCAFDIELNLSHGGKVIAQAYYDGRAVGKVEKSTNGNYVRL